MQIRRPVDWFEVLVTVMLLLGLIGLLIILVQSVRAEAELTIQVSPRVIMDGGSVNVACHVARNPDNRWLDLGIFEYSGSGTEINGATERTTWDQTFNQVPCGSGPAFCILAQDTKLGERDIQVTAPIAIGGCDGKAKSPRN